MQKIIKDLKQYITKNFGRKCKDYNPFCTNCIMWHAYETIQEGAKLCGTQSAKKKKQ